MLPDIPAHDDADDDLPRELVLLDETLIAFAACFLPQLERVVQQTDPAHPHGYEDRNEQIWMAEAEAAPQDDGDQRAVEDDQPAHGRRRALSGVRLRRTLANDLIRALILEGAEDDRSHDERQQQPGHRPAH